METGLWTWKLFVFLRGSRFGIKKIGMAISLNEAGQYFHIFLRDVAATAVNLLHFCLNVHRMLASLLGGLSGFCNKS